MSTTPTNSPKPGTVEWLSGDFRRPAYLQLVLAIVFAIVSAVSWVEWRKSGTPPDGDKPTKAEKKVDDIEELLKKDRKEKDKEKEAEKSAELPRDPQKKLIALWTMLVAALFLLGALWSIATKDDPNRSITVRKIVAVVGSAVGLVSVLLGVVVLYGSQQGLLKWLESGEAEEGKQTVIGLLIILASLGLIFLAILPARAEERKDVTLRRLAHGGNNLIVGLLLLVVLGVANVWVGLKVPEKIDATASKFYSLDKKSEDFLSGLKQTVNLYLIATTQQQANMYLDLESLLKNCERVNSNIKAHFLIPGPNNAEIVALQDRFKLTGAEKGEGILVTVGDNEEKKSFLSLDDLTGFNRRDLAFTFAGENKLMTELSFLASVGGDPVLYFTQGNGELDLFGQGGGPKGRTATKLKQSLEAKKFQLKPLPYEIGQKFAVPPDATAVLVLAPRRALPTEVARALHDYVLPEGPKGKFDEPPPDKKAGRLILVLPPVKEGASDRVAPTGLELLLNDAGLSPSPTILMTAALPGRRRSLPANIHEALGTDRALGPDHPMSRVLVESYFFENPRTFEIGQPRNHSLLSKPIVVSDRNEPTWQEPNFNVDARAMNDAFFDRSNAQAARQLQKEKQLAQRGEPLALLVSESGSPPNPMQPPGPTDEKPRMVVFGSDSVANDDLLNKLPGDTADSQIALIGGSIEWLRERPTSIGIEPRSHTVFVLNPNKIDDWRLFFAPMVWTMAGVLGLGLVVWVLRRS